MHELSRAVAVCTAIMLAGCAGQPQMTLREGAEKVEVGNTAPLGATSLGEIKGIDGSGCRGFGHMGIRTLAEMDLRNKAQAMGADYVQVTSRVVPGERSIAGCHDAAYEVTGVAMRRSSADAASREVKTDGPLVMQPKEHPRERPTEWPPYVKPREMLQPDEVGLPKLQNQITRSTNRYVPNDSAEGRTILANQHHPLPEETRAPGVPPVIELPVNTTPVQARMYGKVHSPLAQPGSAMDRALVPVDNKEGTVTARAKTGAPPGPVRVPAPAAPASGVISPTVSVPAPAAAPATVIPAAVPAAVAPAVVRTPVPAVVEAPAAPAVTPVVPVATTVRPETPTAPPAPAPIALPLPSGGPSLMPPGMPRMPEPSVSADTSLRQVTLSPRKERAAAGPAHKMSKEERDRALDALSREQGLGYEEYQRRYREIMGQ